MEDSFDRWGDLFLQNKLKKVVFFDVVREEKLSEIFPVLPVPENIDDKNIADISPVKPKTKQKGYADLPPDLKRIVRTVVDRSVPPGVDMTDALNKYAQEIFKNEL